MSHTHCYGYGRYISRRRRTIIYATCFNVVLALLLTSCLVIAFTSTGPIILGTEMNTNGMVEYMCLGDGCDDMRPFSWNDKY